MDRAISLEARRVDLAIELPFLLGRARIDPPAHEITIRGKCERMQPQTMKVLVALHDKCGQVVTRDELVDRCWDGRVVSEDVINRCILLLRRFADECGGFRIETVPRAGYRLIETQNGTAAHRPRWALGLAAAAIVGLAAIGLLVRSEKRPPPDEPLTIALLPFTADAGDPETSKVATAARETLANTLAQGAYHVSASDGPPQAARAPADFVISAQFTGASDRIVANVRMEETAHHIVVFSHQFETRRDKADAFPDIVGGEVASQVSWTAPMFEIERRHPSDPAITASILQASSAGLEGSTPLHDYEASRPLAERDPNSPVAQLSFAMTAAFAVDDIPRDQRDEAVAAARLAADRAVSLAPEFGDTHIPWCLLHSEQRLIECEARLRAGMRADPDSPFANWFLACLVLNRVGRNEEGLELARVALAHDPYMANKIGLMLRMLETTGQVDEANELYAQSQRWWPKDQSIDWWRAIGMLERGDFEAMKRFTDQVGDPKHPDPVLLAIHSKSMPAIRGACLPAKGPDANICMLALARFGDANSAFALADRIFPSRRAPTIADEDRLWLDHPDANNTAFLAGPGAAPLRRDPRFIPLADRVGLLAYWRSGRLPDFCRSHPEPVCAQLSRSH